MQQKEWNEDKKQGKKNDIKLRESIKYKIVKIPRLNNKKYYVLMQHLSVRERERRLQWHEAKSNIIKYQMAFTKMKEINKQKLFRLKYCL